MNTQENTRRPPLLLLDFLMVAGLAAALYWPELKLFRYGFLAFTLLWGSQRRGMTTWIMVAMAWGIIIGQDFPKAEYPTYPAYFRLPSQIFLKLIKTVVAPLLFSTLVVGIAGHADLGQVGRMGVKALIYFELVTTLALAVGLGAINLSQAGVGIPKEAVAAEQVELQVKEQNLIEVLLHTFPENVAKSIAEGEVLQIVVFSVIFGIAVAMVSPLHRKPMLEVVEALAETMFKFTNLIMYLAPIAVGSAVAYTVATMGTGVLRVLLNLLLTLYGALFVFLLFVLLPIILLAGVPLVPFLRCISEPVSIAFATASSEAALPRAMERLEELGVPRSVVAFVLPTGYSFNLDGTTLYLALASVFVAQAAGIDMPIQKQIVMMLTLILTSKGVAGVPRASLVILMGTAANFQLPEWPILAIMGIDGLMDMARTAVNVTGNCLASVVVARWEKVFQPNLQSRFYGAQAEAPAAEPSAASLDSKTPAAALPAGDEEPTQS